MIAFITGMILGLIVDFGFQQKIIIDIPSGIYNEKLFFYHGIRIKSIISIVLFFIVALLYFIPFFSDTYKYIIILYLAALAFSFGNYFVSFHRANESFYFDFISQLIQFLVLFLGIFIVGSFYNSITNFCIAFLFSRFLYFLVSYYFTYKIVYNKIHSNRDELKISNLFNKAIPFAVLSWIAGSYLYVDTYILAAYLDETAVGLYQAAFRIMMLTMVVPEIIVMVFTPRLSNLFHNHKDQFKYIFHRLHTVIISIAFFISLTLILFGESILLLLFGEQYISISIYFPYFSLIAFLRYHGSLTGMILLIFNKQILRAIVLVVGIILSIILNIIFIQKYGIFGAILTSVIIHVFINFLYSYYSYKYWNLEFINIRR